MYTISLSLSPLAGGGASGATEKVARMWTIVPGDVKTWLEQTWF